MIANAQRVGDDGLVVRVLRGTAVKVAMSVSGSFALAAAFARTSGLIALVTVAMSVGESFGADAPVEVGLPGATSTDKTSIIVVVGAPGEDEFGNAFLESAARWEKAAQQAGARLTVIGREPAGTPTDYDQVKAAITGEPRAGSGELWLVLLGHGTFDGAKEAKFNLRGPDFSSSELAEWLNPILRPTAIIDASSASSPFMNKLSASNRVVITATRSGYEQNYTRFGRYMSETITDPASDLDKDGETSLLEAFLSASAKLSEFYKTEGRLATEHPLIDDNGDGLGTAPDWFRGVTAVKKAANNASADGPRALQFALIHSSNEQKLPPEIRAKRDQIELSIAKFRDRKAEMSEDEYYQRLEVMLLELARLYNGS